MTKRTNPRSDFTQVAFAVVQEATGEKPTLPKVTPKKKLKKPLGSSSRTGRGKTG